MHSTLFNILLLVQLFKDVISSMVIEHIWKKTAGCIQCTYISAFTDPRENNLILYHPTKGYTLYAKTGIGHL